MATSHLAHMAEVGLSVSFLQSRDKWLYSVQLACTEHDVGYANGLVGPCCSIVDSGNSKTCSELCKVNFRCGVQVLAGRD